MELTFSGIASTYVLKIAEVIQKLKHTLTHMLPETRQQF
jgi:hypothetical protein